MGRFANESSSLGGQKKGANWGIDGLVYFKPDGKTTEKAIVSVKGGDNVVMVRDLAHVVKREKAQIGMSITLVEPTRSPSIRAFTSLSPLAITKGDLA